jgi:biotin carboxyl carrier protein
VTLAEIADLVARAEAAHLAELTVTRDGVTLRLDFSAAPAAGSAPATGRAVAQEASRDAPQPRAVRARSVGRFRAAHPAAMAAAAEPGATVAAGAIVGFLAVGAVLTPVLAEEAGRLGRRVVAEDAVVGWGDAIFLYA